jgi:hypothetical protein
MKAWLLILVPTLALAVEVPKEVRDDALSRAQLWQEPSTPISEADLAITPILEDGFSRDAAIKCKFDGKKPNGLTPKFHCILPDGKELKVKPEILGSESKTESAATRLLSALGFGADRMYQVASVKCKGCPRFVYTQAWTLTTKFRLPFQSIQFRNAAIERKLKGTEISTASGEGWAIYELSAVKPENGGAPRAHVDALKLMIMMLGHWDNKAENQRLICQSPEFKANPVKCEKPFIYLQDLGQTFGPRKEDLKAWASRPIWADRENCKLSMKGFPYDGATFGDTQISEAGRLFLAGLLKQLSSKQIRDLFVGSRLVTDKDSDKLEEKVKPWVTAFEAKIREIVEHPGCPQ